MCPKHLQMFQSYVWCNTTSYYLWCDTLWFHVTKLVRSCLLASSRNQNVMKQPKIWRILTPLKCFSLHGIMINCSSLNRIWKPTYLDKNNIKCFSKEICCITLFFLQLLFFKNCLEKFMHMHELLTSLEKHLIMFLSRYMSENLLFFQIRFNELHDLTRSLY